VEVATGVSGLAARRGWKQRAIGSSWLGVRICSPRSRDVTSRTRPNATSPATTMASTTSFKDRNLLAVIGDEASQHRNFCSIDTAYHYVLHRTQLLASFLLVLDILMTSRRRTSSLSIQVCYSSFYIVLSH
jgi:hypothetical protein